LTIFDCVRTIGMLRLPKSLQFQCRRHRSDKGAMNYQRSASGRLQFLPLTAKQWGVVGAGILVIGAFLISLPLILQVLFGLGRLLFLITMIIVISVAASLAIRKIPRFKKMLADRRKTISFKKDDYHDAN
jgi:hypothetical protein